MRECDKHVKTFKTFDVRAWVRWPRERFRMEGNIYRNSTETIVNQLCGVCLVSSAVWTRIQVMLPNAFTHKISSHLLMPVQTHAEPADRSCYRRESLSLSFVFRTHSKHERTYNCKHKYSIPLWHISLFSNVEFISVAQHCVALNKKKKALHYNWFYGLSNEYWISHFE